MKHLILFVFITLTSVTTPTKPDLKIDACQIEGLSTFDWLHNKVVIQATSIYLINKDVFHVLETQAEVEAKILAANPNRDNCVIEIPNPIPRDK